MPKIFISYRRDDSENITGRIYDRLKMKFGAEAVFMDIDNIPLGVDFREHIQRAVGECDILLAVIGESWLETRHQEGPKVGQRRLDDHGDFVRIEVQAALDRGIPVIPVLVGRATMPGEAMLPQELQKLAFRNAAEVRSGRDFKVDMNRLIRGIKHLAKHEKAPEAKEPQQHGGKIGDMIEVPLTGALPENTLQAKEPQQHGGEIGDTIEVPCTSQTDRALAQENDSRAALRSKGETDVLGSGELKNSGSPETSPPLNKPAAARITVSCGCYQGHNGPVKSVAVSRDGEFVLSGGVDGTVRIWHLYHGKLVATLRGHEGAVWSVAVSPDGSTVASGGADGFVLLWDLKQRKGSYRCGPHSDHAASVAFSPGGSLVLSGGWDGTVRMWDWEQERTLTSRTLKCLGYDLEGTWSEEADMRRLVQDAQQADVPFPFRVYRPIKTMQHDPWVHCVGFSPNGHEILSAGGGLLVSAVEECLINGRRGFLQQPLLNCTVRVWDLATGIRLTLEGHSGPVKCAAFDPTGQHAVSGGTDATIRLWDLIGGAELKRFKGHTGPVHAVGFSPCGERILSGGKDGVLRLWDVKGNELRHLEGHVGAVESVAFAPDGQLAFSGGVDGTLRRWPIPV